jgi:hypothetical protein
MKTIPFILSLAVALSKCLVVESGLLRHGRNTAERSDQDLQLDKEDSVFWDRLLDGHDMSMPTMAACTLELKICPDGSSVGRTGPNCDFEKCPDAATMGCQFDLKVCEDGSTVVRDPQDNCDFEPCPEVGNACPDDLKSCPDGSFVARNPAQNCEFHPCPIVCTFEVMECDDGTIVNRILPDCEFAPCPVETKTDETGLNCTGEVKVCSDNTTVVSRKPYLGCGFAPCPDEFDLPLNCTKDVKVCSDNTTVVSRDVYDSCNFSPCPYEDLLNCTEEVKVCSDNNTLVTRQLSNGCNFAPCPDTLSCTLDVLECADGSFVGRVEPDCEFQPCPIDVWGCSFDVKLCADNSTVVVRDPERDCEFEECPGEYAWLSPSK